MVKNGLTVVQTEKINKRNQDKFTVLHERTQCGTNGDPWSVMQRKRAFLFGWGTDSIYPAAAPDNF